MDVGSQPSAWIQQFWVVGWVSRKKNSYEVSKKFSSLLVIREIQFKTTLRFHVIPRRTVQVNQTTSNKCLKGYEEKGTVIHCCGTIAARSSDSGNPLWRILTKLKYVYHRSQLYHSWHMAMSKGINILHHSHLPSHYHCCHYSLNIENGNSPVSLND